MQLAAPCIKSCFYRGEIWDENPKLSILVRNLRDLTDRHTQATKFKTITKKLRKRIHQVRNLHYKDKVDKLSYAHKAHNLEK